MSGAPREGSLRWRVGLAALHVPELDGLTGRQLRTAVDEVAARLEAQATRYAGRCRICSRLHEAWLLPGAATFADVQQHVVCHHPGAGASPGLVAVYDLTMREGRAAAELLDDGHIAVVDAVWAARAGRR